MGVNARLGGVGYSVEHKGQVWTLAPLTSPIKGLFEDWMRRRGQINLQRQRQFTHSADGKTPPLLSPAEWQEMQSEHVHLVLTDGYSWGTPAFKNSLFAPAGREYLTFLCLREAPGQRDTASEELAATLWAEHTQEMIEALQWLMLPPNSPSPAPTADRANETPGKQEPPPSGAGSACSTAAA